MQFSVITPSFNQRVYLEQTAASVLGQSGGVELRWIVMDGGSTDGTVDFLRSLTDPRVQWTSEKDRGQADALNKGLARATGEVIGWINSDDLYASGALAAVAAALVQNPQAGWAIGQCDIIDASNRTIRPGVTRYKNRGLRRYSYRRLLRENFISQPAVFFRRDWLNRVGPLDASLHHAMDYDLWLRLAGLGDPIVLNQILAHFRIHSTSKTGMLVRDRFNEDLAVAARHVGNDRLSYRLHRLNVEKIVWAYRAMRLLRR
jgi:glycosyltransferase involved in cell wall biosynthesis